jgi:hypothetical protein
MSAKKNITEPLRAYKGFDLNFKCRDFQFAVEGEYKHSGPVVPCDSGFHACTKATDVWDYYPPAESRYAEVELSGTVVPHSGDSKHAASNIKIIRELTNKEFLALVLAEMFAETKVEPSDSKRDCPVCGADCKCETNASSGDYAKNASSGDYATNASSGHSAKNESKGENSVIAAAGANSQAKGATGTWISLAEYQGEKCIGFATGCVGQNGLEPDVWYKAKGGKLVAV